MMGVSERTVQRDWEKARIFLYQRLRSSAVTDMTCASIDSARWLQASAHLDRALDLPPGERDACVDDDPRAKIRTSPPTSRRCSPQHRQLSAEGFLDAASR